jgi:iron complex outermembrane recepter protein
MRNLLLTSTAIMSMAVAAPSYAQSAPAAKEGASKDDTIIVTARRREEKLVDVPIPVSVTTAAQLQRDQVNSITDLQRVTPALEVSQTSGGEVNGGARLRGLGTGVFNASVSPSVAFVVDQVPQGNLAFPVLFDMGQVEVLRGPQGTLFGQGASAGVINVSTVKPTMSGIKASGTLNYANKGTGGSEVGELIADGAFNLPISEKAAARFSVHYKDEKGLQRNTALGLDNDIQDLGLRLRLLFKPTDDMTINLSGEYVRQTMDGWNFFAIATAPNSNTLIDPDGPGPAPTLPIQIFSNGAFLSTTGCNIPVITQRAEFYCEDSQAKMRNTAKGFSAAVDYRMGDHLTLTSITAYRTLNRQTYTVNFSRRLDIAARTENAMGKSSQFSQEFRLNYETDALKLVGGALYSRYQTEALPIDSTLGFGNAALGKRTGFSVCANSGAFCVVPVGFTYEDTKNRTMAVFADATYKLAPKLDLFGGIRFSDYRNTTGAAADKLSPTNTSTITDQNVSGRVGLSYKPESNSTLYVSVARGYKPPALVVGTIAGSAVTPLRAEKSTAVEIGGKMALGRLQLSGNIFYTKVVDFQVQNQKNVAGALISVTQNIAKVESKGFELGIFGRVNDHLTINAGYQYNDVKFPANFLGNDSDPVMAAKLGGTQFLNAPKHKLTLSGEYSQPISSAAELFLNSNIVWKSSVLLGQYGNPAYRYPGHAIVNLGFGVRNPSDKWTLSVFARNLTKQREPTAYLASDFAGTSDGGLRAWPVAGLTARVIGLSVGFKY